MSAHQAIYPIRTMARVLKVSASGYYAWRSRPASARAAADGSDASYPHDPRWIAWNLWRAACSRRAEGRWPLCGPEADCSTDASGRDRGRQPAQKRADHNAAGDRPSSRQRSRPSQLHGRAAERVVGGRHHLPADIGRLSLPRGRSRRLVAPDRRMGLLGRSEDPRRARRSRHGARGPKARQRRPSFGSRLQYTSVAFGNRCKEAGVRPSTGSVGDAYDNAMCESFFATLECELIDRRRFRSHSEARMAVFQFIEGFYNPSRRHSALGYLSPIEYERKHDGLSKLA